MFSEIENISDEILVTRIRHDNDSAFRMLYNRYSKKIYYFSLRYLGNSVESEELVQSVFINVWEHRKSLDETIPVRNYIYKSAVNYIYNFLRKKAIRAKFVESELRKGELSSNLTYEQVFFHDLEISINSVVKTFPDQQQKVFKLSRIDGLSHKEIAEKLELSERTVENHIYRSIKIIKKALNKVMAVLF